MKLFHPDNRNRSEAHKRVYAMHELANTINDLCAAALFVVGSILFGLRPLIKLMRKIRYLRMRDYRDLQE